MRLRAPCQHIVHLEREGLAAEALDAALDMVRVGALLSRVGQAEAYLLGVELIEEGCERAAALLADDPWLAAGEDVRARIGAFPAAYGDIEETLRRSLAHVRAALLDYRARVARGEVDYPPFGSHLPVVLLADRRFVRDLRDFADDQLPRYRAAIALAALPWPQASADLHTVAELDDWASDLARRADTTRLTRLLEADVKARAHLAALRAWRSVCRYLASQDRFPRAIAEALVLEGRGVPGPAPVDPRTGVPFDVYRRTADNHLGLASDAGPAGLFGSLLFPTPPLE